MKSIKQIPTPPNEWLHDGALESRCFSKCIMRPENIKPWAECTDEEKLAWEDAHKVVDEPDKNPS